jgi:subtilisin-like proprotein convertase family protein
MFMTPRSACSTLALAAALAAGLAVALAPADARADGAAQRAGAGFSLDAPTSRGVEPLTLDTPDAFESVAHPADPALPAIRIRARVIVRMQDRATLEALLALRAAKSPVRTAGSADAPLAGFWLVDLPGVRDAAALASSLRADPRVTEAYLDTHRFLPRGLPTDPGFPNQWYLNNTVTPAASTHVVPAWLAGITGAGVTVGIVDEGFNILHPDLAANYAPAASQADLGFADHGTATAGLVGAVANNDKGGAGIAYGASIARLYFGFQSDNAVAFGFHNELNAIKTNSWGPTDNGTIYPMSSIELAALDDAVTTGRAGKGEIIVWACGNGALTNTDRVDYDGYGSNRYAIAVGAIDNIDRASVYSEPGSALMLVTTSSYDFASSGGSGIYSTIGSDTSGPGSYTSIFGGTSASAPLVAGAVALVLQANPNLGWRDVQHVLIRSARRVNPSDAGWTANGAGRFVNYQFGFGALDTAAAVTLAQTFPPRPPERTVSGISTVNLPIPDNSPAGVVSAIPVNANLTVERVQVVLTAPHARLGDLRVVLTSPSGSASILAIDRNDFSTGYDNFVFTSVRHWDERSHGVWSLRVSDMRSGVTGTLTSWQLKVYGTTPDCPCDWNGNGLSVSDIFDFLNDWFAGVADFNNDGTPSVQDIFDFLGCWFTQAGACH